MAPSLLFILLIPLYLQVNSQNLSSEQTILLSLKQHWGNHPALSSWNSDSSQCNWRGIECTSGVVTRLSLAGENISGTIPSSISQLKHLVSIDLSRNELSGTIPGELFVIESIWHLYLNGNRLFGEIPTPKEASSLEFLDLSDNRLNGSIPDDIITNLHNLTDLDLSKNFFSGTIPGELFLMKRLRFLYLNGNKLFGDIPTPKEGSSLEFLGLSGNRFNGSIPDGITNLYNLTYLDLSVNSFSGTIPGELFLMKRLRGLSLRGNRLFGEIPTPKEASSLEFLDLSDNRLNGSIPDDIITNLHNLTDLDLSKNFFSGTIPGELFLMKGLRELSLNGNRLFGEIPTPIQASSLWSLDLSDNRLNGSIPDDIANLQSLTDLDLSMNFFSGTIPAGLFRMRELGYLSLGYNNLTGQLPAQMDFDNYGVLNLTHNHLHGTIPKSLSKIVYLMRLDLSDNHLSGNITEDLYNLGKIGILMLCSNKFVGMIPYEFVNGKFDKNCLDRSNLCSDNRTEGLQSCPSSLCSDDRFQGFLKCDHKHDRTRRRHFVIIMVGIAGCGAVGFAILYYLARKCWLKKHESIIARFKNIWPSGPSTKDEEKWKMVAFQRLKFNASDILSGLTDRNLIGNGGSGKVYRVFIKQTSNYVAVKSISNPRKSDHRLEREFLSEIQTLGNIRHLNIVKLLCYISSKDSKLLVYQYFKNKSLDQWLHGDNREISSVGNSSLTKLDWPMRLHIALGAAQGICYMHHDCSLPIVHRDIKSSNILLDSEFNAKIADFGLSKLLTRHGDTETASTVAGTFGYIAPEYAYSTKVNTKIDVYSFGVVLLELTTGREAVTRGDHMNLAERAQLLYRDTSAVIDALDDEIKESIYLDQIIAVFRLGVNCTATSPSNRPSMKDCVRILQNCCKSSSASSPNVQ